MQIEDDGYWHQSMQRLPSPEDNDVLSIHESYTGGKSVLREVGETIVLTPLIFFAVRAVVQNFKVEGDSMLPSLHSEQYLLVNKALYFRYDANLLAHLTNKDAAPDMRYESSTASVARNDGRAAIVACQAASRGCVSRQPSPANRKSI